MGNRIDGSTSNTSDVSSTRTSAADADAADGSDGTDGTDQTRDRSRFYTDQLIRGADRQAEFEKMTTGQKADSGAGSSADASTDDEATTVFEMRAAQSAQRGGVDYEDDAVANKLAGDVFENENLDLFDQPPEEIDRAFDSALADEFGFNGDVAKNAELLDDRKGLEAFIADKLVGRSDAPDDAAEIERVAAQLADNVEDRATRGVTKRIEERARAQLDGARETIGQINADSPTRRTFLAQLARAEGDPEVIQARLAEFGVEESKADEIAGVVAGAHGDPSAIEALEAGEPGDEVGTIFKEGEFDRADSLLEEGLDEMDGKLERLADDALGKVGSGDHERLLIDPNFAQARAEVFNEFDIDVDQGRGGQDGLERAMSGATERAASDKEAEKWTKAGAAVVLGGFGALATGGLAAGVAGAAIQGGAGVGVKQEELELARAAQQSDLGADGVVDDATTARNAEVVKAAAGVVLAGSNAGGKVSEMLAEKGAAQGLDEFAGGAAEAAAGEAFGMGVDEATDQ